MTIILKRSSKINNQYFLFIMYETGGEIMTTALIFILITPCTFKYNINKSFPEIYKIC